ncbi:hypothetical protein PN36_02000 [Candidatus Thiomargarita nelsonii]|uniref:Uncharacterized protein n=1 Tax=Candidatus Thiomargarita nelsonii TaxID=1003181 RepID=A0A4E0QWN7_9GAMM|nr:hypothetical protein PN36_02000 [Candidatus Thiomargarita nelsonii]
MSGQSFMVALVQEGGSILPRQKFSLPRKLLPRNHYKSKEIRFFKKIGFLNGLKISALLCRPNN